MSRLRLLVIVIGIIWFWNTVLSDHGASLGDSGGTNAVPTATVSSWDHIPAP
jgi:hypothetical protein